jgi:hypothetical protein
MGGFSNIQTFCQVGVPMIRNTTKLTMQIFILFFGLHNLLFNMFYLLHNHFEIFRRTILAAIIIMLFLLNMIIKFLFLLLSTGIVGLTRLWNFCYPITYTDGIIQVIIM